MLSAWTKDGRRLYAPPSPSLLTQYIHKGRPKEDGRRNEQVSHNRSCNERESRHQLVRRQNLAKKTSENQASQKSQSIWIRKEPNCMNRDGVSYSLPSFGHLLNITWPQAWWSSPLASETSQLIRYSYRIFNFKVVIPL